MEGVGEKAAQAQESMNRQLNSTRKRLDMISIPTWNVALAIDKSAYIILRILALRAK